MNQEQHKANAERLIVEANQAAAGGFTPYELRLVRLAHVHAVLATIPDPVEAAPEPRKAEQ